MIGDRDSVHIGQMRVSFEYERCGKATVISQQISLDKHNFSFRKWQSGSIAKPLQRQPSSEDLESLSKSQHSCESAEEEHSTELGTKSTVHWLFSLLCCCLVSESLYNYFAISIDETVDYVGEVSLSKEKYFESKSKTNAFLVNTFRFWCFVLNVLGILLTTVPFLGTGLKGMPLVKALLTMQTGHTAFCFALVCGLTLTLTIISAVKLFYRPLLGLTLTALSGLIIFFIAVLDS